jgi:hypothetical protein
VYFEKNKGDMWIKQETTRRLKKDNFSNLSASSFKAVSSPSFCMRASQQSKQKIRSTPP